MNKFALAFLVMMAPVAAKANVTFVWETQSVDLGLNPAATPNLTGYFTLTDAAYNNPFGGSINFNGQVPLNDPTNVIDGVVSASLSGIVYDAFNPPVEEANSYLSVNFQRVGTYLQGSGNFQSRDETLLGGTNDPSNPNVWTFTYNSYLNGCSECKITGVFVDDPPNSVPEPASLSMLVFALLSLLTLTWRKRHH